MTEQTSTDPVLWIWRDSSKGFQRFKIVRKNSSDAASLSLLPERD